MKVTARSGVVPSHECIPLRPSATFGFTVGERRRDHHNNNSVASYDSRGGRDVTPRLGRRATAWITYGGVLR